jgi:hypothetical protein
MLTGYLVAVKSGLASPVGAETCATWVDALQIAVGPARVRALGGQVLVCPEVR